MLVMQKRCPWCGKKVKIHGLMREKKKTPQRFIYKKCEHCNQFYGQNYLSGRVVISCSLMFATIPVLILHNNFLPIVLLFILFLSFYVLNSPLIRMDEDEKFLFDTKQSQSSKIIWNNINLKKGYIYLLTNDFDNNLAYSQISPIIIKRIDKKSKIVYFVFLYEHVNNIDIKNKDSFLIYKDSMCIASLKHNK